MSFLGAPNTYPKRHPNVCFGPSVGLAVFRGPLQSGGFGGTRIAGGFGCAEGVGDGGRKLCPTRLGAGLLLGCLCGCTKSQAESCLPKLRVHGLSEVTLKMCQNGSRFGQQLWSSISNFG